MEQLMVALGITCWVLLGAVIAASVTFAIMSRKLVREVEFARELAYVNGYIQGSYARGNFGAWLGMPCWMDDRRGNPIKYRIVAVSHKGAISIRRWDDGSGKHAFWVRKKDVAKNVRFTEGGE